MFGLFENKTFVAIDYDRRKVRLVVFGYVRGAAVIRTAHAVKVEDGVDVTDTESMGRFLGTVVDRLHLRGAAALMCVGRAQALLKSLQLPAGPDSNELASMVQFQVNKELPFPAEEAVVDFTQAEHFDVAEAGAAEEGTPVLAAAVRLPVIDAARVICEQAGLKLKRLGLRPYANLRAVYHCTRCKPGERILLVNVTADDVEIDVMRDEMLEFSRAATLTGGTNHPHKEDSGETVRRAVMEVARSLQSFQALQSSSRIDACLVAGDTGEEPEIAQTLARRLNIPCNLFDPGPGFGLRSGIEASGFGAALGLAAGQGTDALPFDFVNPKRPVAPRNTRRTKALALVAAVVVLVCGIAAIQRVHVGRRKADVKKLGNDVEKLQTTHNALKKVATRTAAIQAWEQADVNWLDQLAHLSNTMPDATKVYLTSMRCSASNAVSLSGGARDHRDLTAFTKTQMDRPGYQVRPRTVTTNERFGYELQFSMDLLVSPKAKPLLKAKEFIARPADDAAGEQQPPTGRAPAGSSRRTTRGRTDRRRRPR